MDFNLTAEQREMQEAVRKFAQAELAPKAMEHDEKAEFPRGNFEQMADMGLLGLLVPEEYGGVGSDVVTFCLAIEEIAYACASTSLSYLAHSVLVCYNLSQNASHEQKLKYLPDLCSGKKFGCLCITEPGAGSDALGMQTFAEKRGDSWVLNGSKTFITNAPVADVFLVYARTDKQDRARGISQFIIEKDTPGLSTGKPFKKLGNKASPTSEVFFNDCVVPEANLVQGENQALGILMGNLDVERVVGAAMGVGGSRAAFDRALKYAMERIQFDQPIIMHEMISDKLALMATKIEASKWLTLHGAWLCDQGVRCSEQASYAKLFASETANYVTDEAIQILGGYGYMQEYEVERMMRDARLGSIGAGTSEIQKLIIVKEIAKRRMAGGL
jgi:alkylation response protein AidB-like acyl-CoA dehydrogenase